MTLIELEKLRQLKIPKELSEIYQKLINLGYENINGDNILKELILIRGITNEDICKILFGKISERNLIKTNDFIDGNAKLSRPMKIKLSDAYSIPVTAFH